MSLVIQVLFIATLFISIISFTEWVSIIAGNRIVFHGRVTVLALAYPSILFQIWFWSQGMF